MPNYTISTKAIEDLSNIWFYTFENWSESQADNYYNQLLAIFNKLAHNPNLGKNYPSISAEYFGYLGHQHIVFYQKFQNEILIVRILHGRADLPSYFLA